MQFPPIQPTGLFGYLSFKKLRVPHNVQRYFYVSWEDALWDVLLHFKVKKGAKILLPSFFCLDVVENMKVHGLVPVWYEVDRNFQTDTRTFEAILRKEQPDIVVILHAVGITNQLFAQKEKWLDAFQKESILIEDSVHRIVDPARLDFIHPRHLVIDSLRKVVPLAGSNLYGVKPTIAGIKQTAWWNTVPYQWSVIVWWMIFHFYLSFNLSQKAEQAMIKGYDYIGDSYQAGRGWWWFEWLALYIDVGKIEKIKVKQVIMYKKLLDTLWSSDNYFVIKIPETDFGKLRGFPIGIKIKNAQAILETLRSEGFITRFELSDSLWSQKQKVIYLPLGPHVSEQLIKNVCSLLLRVI